MGGQDVPGRGTTPSFSCQLSIANGQLLGTSLFDGDVVASKRNQTGDLDARQAFRQYGKVRHPAALNFGDCFSYALAKASGFPLLFKGEDFKKTDIQTALA